MYDKCTSEDFTALLLLDLRNVEEYDHSTTNLLSIILLLGSAIEFQVGPWGCKVFSMANFLLSVDFYTVLGYFCTVPGRSRNVKICGWTVESPLQFRVFNGKFSFVCKLLHRSRGFLHRTGGSRNVKIWGCGPPFGEI